MALASKDEIGGGLAPFFDYKNYLNDLAIIFEPRSVREGLSKYTDQKTGEKKKQTNVTTVITVFRSQTAIDKGEPDFKGSVVINQPALAKDLVDLMQKMAAKGDNTPAIIKRIEMYQPKEGNKTPVFRDVAEGDYDRVVAYYESQQASVPDF